MSEARTSSDKSNACKIRSRVHQAIFKAFLETSDNVLLLGNRPELSRVADIATKGIMNESRLNVVLSKPKPS